MRVFAIVLVLLQGSGAPPLTLPPPANAQLSSSVESAKAATRHLWRDTAPVNSDGTVNAYIEIARGDRRKWEYAMAKNARAIDRVMPPSLGGYPVNYGFVPQTVSYDGDPFDALVLGPAIAGGRLVRGAIVGIMHMDDEKGLDSKVVLSLVGSDGRPVHQLTAPDQQRMGSFFDRYKLHEPGKFSKVSGWGTPETGLAFVRATHRFFKECPGTPKGSCQLQ